MNKKLFVVPCYTVVYAKDDEEVEEIVREYFDGLIEPDIYVNQEFRTIENISDIPEGWNQESPCLEMVGDEDGDYDVTLALESIKDILRNQKKKDVDCKISNLEHEIKQLQKQLKNLKDERI